MAVAASLVGVNCGTDVHAEEQHAEDAIDLADDLSHHLAASTDDIDLDRKSTRLNSSH